MQKFWYIIYTKPKCEKKVATIFAKRKIHAFCPLNRKTVKSVKKSKLVIEPLFNSYVFVNVEEIKLSLLAQFDNVINLVYWKGKPATIEDREIEAIKEFTLDHQNIMLKKIAVDPTNDLKIDDIPSYTIDGKILMIKARSISLSLPSIGFTLIAELSGPEIINAFENTHLKIDTHIYQ